MKRRAVLKSLPILGAALSVLPGAALAKRGDSRPLCLEYVDGITKGIKRIRDTQKGNLAHAAEAIARTRKAGGNCFYQWETNHTIEGDMFPDRPGDTGLFVMGYTMGTPAAVPKSGNLLLVNVIRAPLEDPRAKGIFVIGGPNPWCADTDQGLELTESNRKLVVKPYSDIWIELFYTPYAALVKLPGQEVPLGPTPGAYGMATCWAMVADAVRLLAREGVAVRVRGDEPTLGNKTKQVNLDRPLGERFLTESLHQIGKIRGEIDTVRDIAAAAADRILSGGKLYVYSRYREALCMEASGRRGGLALLNTTWAEDPNFKGTEKDFMVMGITSPDDQTDLRLLEKYRKMGIKIAAIGPSTRDGLVPPGRTVPSGADFHLGKMCDTYGLFAVPGLDRKVCPTSGLLVNVMFWTVAVQLAGKIMRRTGNSPAVLSTGAVAGGAEQRAKCAELVKARGY